MYMIGRLKRAAPTSVSIEEAFTSAMALAIQRLVAATAIRLAPAAASVVAQLCTSSKILRALDARAKFHNQVNEQDMVIDIHVLQCHLMDLS